MPATRHDSSRLSFSLSRAASENKTVLYFRQDMFCHRAVPQRQHIATRRRATKGALALAAARSSAIGDNKVVNVLRPSSRSAARAFQFFPQLL